MKAESPETNKCFSNSALILVRNYLQTLHPGWLVKSEPVSLDKAKMLSIIDFIYFFIFDIICIYFIYIHIITFFI